MKLFIEEAYNLAIAGDVKGAFAELFKGFGTIEEFFNSVINYLRKTLGVPVDE